MKKVENGHKKLIPFDDEFQSHYPAVMAGNNAAAIVAGNLGGETITAADLDRVKVPSGGATSWQVPSLEGEVSVKAIEGIIVYSTRRRAYWSSPEPTGDMPDCASTDCVTGVGKPGGECAGCPLNEFGTQVKKGGAVGRGKACRESRLLFVLQPGETLPMAIVVPSGSLKIIRGYLLKLDVPYFSATHKLELSVATNKDGIKYAQVKPSMTGRLSPDAAKAVQSYVESLRSVFESVTIDAHDVGADGGDDPA